ncbi:hypothetical protein Tco_1005617 [Tanacetum coccineum]|uniref:Uncharacterized protein n=1 Tax=Tanacetum coccineum TaxID=301880 RepID=A0ABQ5FFZ1_9ASTR
MVPTTVLMKSGLVSVNNTRQVIAAHSKTTVIAARPKHFFLKQHIQLPKAEWFNAARQNGWSRHMTGNMSYLTDYEEIDRGYVAFRWNPKGWKITGKGINLLLLLEVNAAKHNLLLLLKVNAARHKLTTAGEH